MTQAASGRPDSQDSGRDAEDGATEPAGGLLAYQTWIRWAGAAAILAALFVMASALPVEEAVRAARGWVQSLGAWGPAAFGACYVVGSLVMVPGAPMTVAAGALFRNFWVAFLTVNLGATLTGTIAFLAARHLARGRVQDYVNRHRKFAALDAALEQGGWKILVLLRLSPAVPFTPVNYALGLTRARLGPYMLATWLGTMPGTVLYVYLGEIGAKIGGGGPIRWQQWLYLGFGLAATVVATVYLARLSRQKLAEQTDMETEPEKRDAPAAWKWTTFLLAGLALAAVAGAVVVKLVPVRQLFGAPPTVTAAEKYEKKPGGPTFDHSAWDALLKRHVNGRGGVDYPGFKADQAKLDGYLDALAEADFESLGRDEKLALLLNAYNAFTVKLILDHGIPASIKDIPDAERWDAVRWTIAGKQYSLNQIEHEQIRPKFEEPRVHFALVCAAEGCPPLRAGAYSGAKVSEELSGQAEYCLTHPRWLVYDGGDAIKLTSILDWYGGDFKPKYGSVLKFVGKYVPAAQKKLDAGQALDVQYLDYSWKLNNQTNVPAK